MGETSSSYKQFVAAALITAWLPLTILALVNYLTDPFEIFQTNLFTKTGVVQERFIKIEFLKHNTEFDIFLLGGSRAGTTPPSAIESVYSGHRAYNMYVSSGNQYDVRTLGQWLLKNHKNTRTLIVQFAWPESSGPFVESLQYRRHPDISGESPLGFYLKYIFAYSFPQIAFKWHNNFTNSGNFSFRLDEGSYRFPLKDAALDEECSAYWEKVISEIGAGKGQVSESEWNELLERNISDLHQLINDAKIRDVNVVVFIPPHHHMFLGNLDKSRYEQLLRRLSQITEFWNLAYYSSMTTNNCNYYEPSHYTERISGLVVNALRVPIPVEAVPYIRFVNQSNIDSEVRYMYANFESYARYDK